MNVILLLLMIFFPNPTASIRTASAISASDAVAAKGLAKATIVAGPEDFSTFTLGQLVVCLQKRPPGTPVRTVELLDDGGQEYRLHVQSSLGDIVWHFTATPNSAVFDTYESDGAASSDPNFLSQVMLMSGMACAMNGNLGSGQDNKSPLSETPAGQP